MESIQVLGAYGGKSDHQATTTLLIDEHITIDAGNLMAPLGDKARLIDHIFITHSHLDHITDIPFLIDAFFNDRTIPLNIYALPETISALKRHIFNWEVWPDFNEINLINQSNKAVLFHPISFGVPITIGTITLEPFRTNHTVASCGYIIRKGTSALMFTSDTYRCDMAWKKLNTDTTITALITEVSFPSQFARLAEDSRHLTPAILVEELAKLTRDDVTIYLNHMKPSYEAQIRKELEALGLFERVTLLYDSFSVLF